jgi:hypothetical protein
MPWKNNVNEMRDKVLQLLSGWVDCKTFKAEQFKPAFVVELPLVAFYFGDETVDDDKSQPIIKKRRLSLNIDICRAADQDEQLDAWLYERAFEVEQVLDNSKFLGFDYVQEMMHTAVTPGTIPRGTDQQVRVLRVTYTIVYTTEIKPTQGLDEFLKFQAEYDIDQDQTRMEATDFVTIREA